MRHLGALLFISLVNLACTRRETPTPAATPPSATATRPPSASSPSADSSRSRVVRFAGGIATVEIDGSTDHVIVTDSPGKLLSESWCPRETGDYDTLVALFVRLRNAVTNHDARATADLLRYPFRVNAATPRIISNAKILTARFEEVFSAVVVAKIRSAEPQALFCRNGSGMLGNGVIWAHAEHGLALADVLNQ